MHDYAHIEGVAIDLDGTLLDTVADLAAAANAMRIDFGLAPLPVAQIESYVGKGAQVLVQRVLSDHVEVRDDNVRLRAALASFHRHYERENGRCARAYRDVREGLCWMRDSGLRLACVTNKPQAFADPLLERTGLAEFFEPVLGGDALPRKKPDPLPLLHLCERFGLPAERMLMIGDSINDAQAARAAGMPIWVVPYGYNEGRPATSIDADLVVDSLLIAAQRLRPCRTD